MHSTGGDSSLHGGIVSNIEVGVLNRASDQRLDFLLNMCWNAVIASQVIPAVAKSHVATEEIKWDSARTFDSTLRVETAPA